MMWLVKVEYRYEYYINKIIFDYVTKNNIEVKSITTDNGH